MAWVFNPFTGKLDWTAAGGGGGITSLTANTTPMTGFSAGQYLFSDGSVLKSGTFGTGVATALGNAINASGGIITFAAFAPASGKSLTLNNTLTLAGTDSTTMTFPSTSATIARTDAGQTFTGAQTFSVGSVNGTGLDISQTWTGTGTYTGLKYNVTDSGPANAASLLLDLQVGGQSQSYVQKNGNIVATSISLWPNQTPGSAGGTPKSLWAGPNNTTVIGRSGVGIAYATGNGFGFANSTALLWGTSDAGENGNLFLTRANTATLQLGAADVASGAVAQTLQVQSNTGAGQSGQTFTIKGSAGPAGGGSIIFQTAATTTHAAALTLGANKNATFAGLLAGTSSFDGGINLSSGGVGSITIGNFSGGSTISDIVAIGGGSSGYMSAGISLRSSAILGWAASTNPLAAQDTILARDAANTLALRNGTNAQTFNVYNTYTDTANYERGYARWSGNVFQIGTEKGTSGNARQLQFQVNGSNVLTFATNEVGTLINTLNVVYSSKTKISIWPALTVGLNLANNQSIGWDSTDSAGTSPDTILIRGGAANVIGIGGATSSFPALKRSSTTLQVRLADDTGFASLSSGSITINGGGASTISNSSTETVFNNGFSASLRMVLANSSAQLKSPGTLGLILGTGGSGNISFGNELDASVYIFSFNIPTTATLQLGAADVSSGNAVAQTLRVQSTTAASQTAPDFTIQGSRGTTAGGSIIFQTAATSTYTTALTLTPAQKAEFASSIKTGTPNGGTAAEWKLGVRVAATTTLDTTQYIEVDVGGTLYKLAVVTV